MNLSLFYRHPLPEYHSIENIFDTVVPFLPDDVHVHKIYAPHKSIGFIKRIKIAWHARKNQGGINHITGYDHFIAPFLKKKKTILTIHDVGSIKYGNFLKKFLLKLFWFSIPAKSVAYITVISEFTKKELLAYVNIKPDKVVLVPNCISKGFQYSPKKFNGHKPIILQIGTKANKNLTRVIEAIKDVVCKLLILGKLSAYQIDLLKSNKIEYENHFNISDDDLIKLYKRADIVSFVSTYEGFGMPIIEANAVGRMVISSDIEPMKTVAGNAAYLVDPYDVAAIRKGLQTLIKDASLRKRFIENGLQNAKKYSAASIAKQYHNLYLKVLNSGPSSEKQQI